MSTQNAKRTRPQKYQNTRAFRHNKHSRKTQQILSSPNVGLCQRCTDKIEWKKKYRKYKPLTQPKKCAKCGNKTVIFAYHVICQQCATSMNICAWCRQVPPVREFKTKADEQIEEKKLKELIEGLSERQKRAFLRQLDRGEAAEGIESGNSIASDEISESDDIEESAEGSENSANDGARNVPIKSSGTAPTSAGDLAGSEDEDADEDEDGSEEESNEDDIGDSMESYEDDSLELDAIDQEIMKQLADDLARTKASKSQQPKLRKFTH